MTIFVKNYQKRGWINDPIAESGWVSNPGGVSIHWIIPIDKNNLEVVSKLEDCIRRGEKLRKEMFDHFKVSRFEVVMYKPNQLPYFSNEEKNILRTKAEIFASLIYNRT